jgi:hypothetical protein
MPLLGRVHTTRLCPRLWCGMPVAAVVILYGMIELAMRSISANRLENDIVSQELIHIMALGSLQAPCLARCEAKVYHLHDITLLSQNIFKYLIEAFTEISPTMGSENSADSKSSDNLEIGMASRSNGNPYRPQAIVYAESNVFERLHRSTTRKVGEAPLSKAPPPAATKQTTTAVNTVVGETKKQRWSLLGKRSDSAISA